METDKYIGNKNYNSVRAYLIEDVISQMDILSKIDENNEEDRKFLNVINDLINTYYSKVNVGKEARD